MTRPSAGVGRRALRLHGAVSLASSLRPECRRPRHKPSAQARPKPGSSPTTGAEPRGRYRPGGTDAPPSSDDFPSGQPQRRVAREGRTAILYLSHTNVIWLILAVRLPPCRARTAKASRLGRSDSVRGGARGVLTPGSARSATSGPGFVSLRLTWCDFTRKQRAAPCFVSPRLQLGRGAAPAAPSVPYYSVPHDWATP